MPLEDSLGELARLQKEGKIRHVGVSNFNVEELRGAQRRAGRLGAEPLQRGRPCLRGRAELCAREDIAFIPWAPIARGTPDRLDRIQGKGFEEWRRHAG